MAALPLIAFWSLVTPLRSQRASIVPGDFTEVHFPMHFFVVQSWQQRRLPLWAPGINGGQPAFADIQFDAFYPPTVLTGLLLGPRGTFTPEMLIRSEVAQVFAGELGMYLLVLWLLSAERRRRLADDEKGSEATRRAAAIPAALTGAVVFGFSGYLTTYPVQDTDILQASIWLPWAVVALDYALVRRSAGIALVAGLPVSVVILAGHPQVLLYIAYAHVFYTLVFAAMASNTLRSRLATIACGLLTLGGGLALGAVQLLPTLQLAPLTVRGSEDYAFLSGGFAPLELTGTVFARGFGGATPAYLGVAPLALALIGASRGDRRLRVYALALGGIALLLSLGNHSFLYRLAFLAAPGFAEVRDQERAIFLVTFAVALLAASGVQELMRGSDFPASADHNPILPRLLPAALAAVLLIGAGYSLVLGAGVQRIPAGATASALRLNIAGLDHALLLLLAATALLTLALWRPGLRPAACWSLSLLCAIDLLSAHPGYGTQPGVLNPYPDWGIIQTLQAEHSGPFRVSSEGLLPADGNEGLIYHLEDVVGSTPLELSSFEAMNQAERRRQIDEIRHLELLNVRYIVTQRTFPAAAPLQLLGSHGSAHLYRLAPELVTPRAWLVHAAQVATGDALWRAIGQVDVTRVVVLARLPATPLGQPGADTTRLTAYAATRLAWSIHAASPGLLVVSQMRYPGWQATVDGVPAPVLPADGAIDAIPVPAGDHQVTLRFDPPILHLAAEISAVTLALMVVGGVWLR